jgi:hypothetical protein
MTLKIESAPVSGAPSSVGASVGVPVGKAVGDTVGTGVGNSVGEPVGKVVGNSVGEPVGKGVGNSVGEFVNNGTQPPGTNCVAENTALPSELTAAIRME